VLARGARAGDLAADESGAGGTLATVGYGDYTAASNLGHTLAVGEALLGQLYLVTIVGVLVGRMRPRRA
jgi:hypothetical protein